MTYNEDRKIEIRNIALGIFNEVCTDKEKASELKEKNALTHLEEGVKLWAKKTGGDDRHNIHVLESGEYIEWENALSFIFLHVINKCNGNKLRWKKDRTVSNIWEIIYLPTYKRMAFFVLNGHYPLTDGYSYGTRELDFTDGEIKKIHKAQDKTDAKRKAA